MVLVIPQIWIRREFVQDSVTRTGVVNLQIVARRIPTTF
jgi:hypothetical protein